MASAGWTWLGSGAGDGGAPAEVGVAALGGDSGTASPLASLLMRSNRLSRLVLSLFGSGGWIALVAPDADDVQDGSGFIVSILG